MHVLNNQNLLFSSTSMIGQLYHQINTTLNATFTGCCQLVIKIWLISHIFFFLLVSFLISHELLYGLIVYISIVTSFTKLLLNKISHYQGKKGKERKVQIWSIKFMYHYNTTIQKLKYHENSPSSVSILHY